jgi:LysR family transcriptional regulator, transcriptional activator for dmlA
MIDLADLRHFVTVYQCSSFTTAAKRLGVSKVAVAKRISAFEHRRGLRLFRRSTRRIAPTPEADQMYAHALELLQRADEFELQLGNRSPMEGVVRVTCPNAVALAFAGDLIVAFQERHPGLEVQLISTDSVLDLIEHNIDLAIRVGDLRSASLIGRKLGANELAVCAAPSYLKQAPPIRSLTDLKRHPVFCMNYHLGARFKSTGQRLEDVIGAPRLATNEGLLVTQLGLNGRGVVIRSRWSVRKDLEAGRLVSLLPKHPLEPLGNLWLLGSAGRLQSARIRAVFEMLVEGAREYLP